MAVEIYIKWLESKISNAHLNSQLLLISKAHGTKAHGMLSTDHMRLEQK